MSSPNRKMMDFVPRRPSAQVSRTVVTKIAVTTPSQKKTAPAQKRVTVASASDSATARSSAPSTKTTVKITPKTPTTKPVTTKTTTKPVVSSATRKTPVRRPASRPTTTRVTTRTATRRAASVTPVRTTEPIRPLRKKKSPTPVRRISMKQSTQPPANQAQVTPSKKTSPQAPKSPQTAVRSSSSLKNPPRGASRPTSETELVESVISPENLIPSESEINSQPDSAAISREVSALISPEDQESIVGVSVDETVVVTSVDSGESVEDDQVVARNITVGDFVAEVEPLKIDEIANSESNPQTDVSTAPEFEDQELRNVGIDNAELVARELENEFEDPMSDISDSEEDTLEDDELETLEEAFSMLEESDSEAEEIVESENNNATMGLTDFEDLRSTPIESPPFLAVEVEKRPLSAHRDESYPTSQSTQLKKAPVTPSNAPASVSTHTSPQSSSTESKKQHKKRIRKNYKGKSKNTIALVIAIIIALALGICVGVLVYLIFFQK